MTYKDGTKELTLSRTADFLAYELPLLALYLVI